MKKFYALGNFLVILGIIFWNYYANAKGINGNTVGELSREYNNLFTPASYAFSIWGLIFLALTAHGIFQIKRVFIDKKKDEFVMQIGGWLLLANIANASWIWFWLSEYTGLSVLIMATILYSLLMIVLRLNMERWNAPKPLRVWVWWPIGLYIGWIAVAMIANVSAYLAKLGWTGGFTEVTWTIVMIIAAILVNLFMLYTRSMRGFALVGVWALVAIAIRHYEQIPPLEWAATTGAILLIVAIGIQGYRRRNRNTSVISST